MESPVCGTSVSPLGAEGACSCPVVQETVCSEQQQEQCTTETTEVCAVLYCAVLYCTVQVCADVAEQVCSPVTEEVCEAVEREVCEQVRPVGDV